MSLKHVHEILNQALENKKAVMTFECVNFEQMAWSIEAAENCGQPVILMLYFDMDFYTAGKHFMAMGKALAEAASVPVGLTYVYANTEELVQKAIDDGFPSICYDPQGATLEEKIQETRKIVALAHAAGVDVSANPGVYEDAAADAVCFAKETGIDAMVAPIVYPDEGNNYNFAPNQHWSEDNVDHIDFAKLKAIFDGCGLPLILHQSYNVSDADLCESRNYGITKVDCGSPFDTACWRAVQKGLEQDCGNSMFALLLEAKPHLMTYLETKIRTAAQ